MLSFIGDYSCKADSKCRVVVPASFRKSMEESRQTVFVLRKNVFEACIDMYPYCEWEMLLSGLRAKLNPFNPEHARFMRDWFRGTQEVEMDGNGRVLLPRRLLEEIGVDREFIFAGQDSKIEIWDAKVYEGMAVDGAAFAQLAQDVFK